MKKTINFNGMEVVVSYGYIKAEPMTWEYPGCPEEYNVQTVECCGQLINDFIDHYDLWDDVTECLEVELAL